MIFNLKLVNIILFYCCQILNYYCLFNKFTMINFDELDLNTKIETKSNFSFSDFGVNTLLGCNLLLKQPLMFSPSVLHYTLQNVSSKSNKSKTLTQANLSNSAIISSVTLYLIFSPMFTLRHQTHFPWSQSHTH